MSSQQPNEAKPAAGPAQDPRDLSSQIVATVSRKPGDLVKCTWVGGDCYRCNWWSAKATGGFDNPALSAPTYGTHVVRKSQFLHVVATPDGLRIREAAPDIDRR